MSLKMRNLRVFLSVMLAVLLAALLTGLVFTQPSLAQEGQPTVTPTLEPEVVPRQDIPGDTTVLLVAAAGLVIIALGAVVWHNRDRR
jgi:hypothetical protein